MGMEKKYLHGLVRDSRGFAKGEYMPWAFTTKGRVAIIGGVAAFALAKEGLAGHNQRKLGKVTYTDGPARMTGSFTSGAIPAMNRASGGNEQLRNEMFVKTMKTGPGGSSPLNAIDNYGVDGAFISSLYNMGG